MLPLMRNSEDTSTIKTSNMSSNLSNNSEDTSYTKIFIMSRIMEVDEKAEMHKKLQKALEKKYGYREFFHHTPLADPNKNREMAAWCKLCNHRSMYNVDDGSDVTLKIHIRFHLGQVEEQMEEERRKFREAVELGEKEKEILIRDILKNAESAMGFWEYFEHHELGNRNRPEDKEGTCKLCRIPITYVLGESVSNLREHFDDHVLEYRTEARKKEEEKKKIWTDFMPGSSSTN